MSNISKVSVKTIFDKDIRKDNRKKILFINPCLRTEAKVKYVPVGIAYVMQAAKKAGFEFDFLDLDIVELSDEELKVFFNSQKYDICGIGCIVTGLKEVKKITTFLRESSPECVIFAGNSVATSIPELLLRNTEVDIASLGEGDITVVELLNALEEGKDFSSIKGLAFIDKENNFIKTEKRNVIADLDTIGFPDWEMFDLVAYTTGGMKQTFTDENNDILFPLNGARGCLYSCTFCYHVFKGEKYRKYSDAVILEEFKRLTTKYNADTIAFWDELSFPDIATVEKLVKTLESYDFGKTINWRGSSRANLFTMKDVDLIKRMYAIGCRSIAFSIENAAPEILKAMNKKIDHKKTIEHSHAMHAGGLTPGTSLIFGYPQETPETIKATLDLCEECNIYPSVGYLLPLPGTPVYEDAKKSGHIRDEIEFLMGASDRQDLYINLTKMPDDEFQSCVVENMNALAKKMGLSFENPLKTGVYQKPKN